MRARLLISAPMALYLTVINRGAVADTVLGVESDAADTVALHQQMSHGGTSSMMPVGKLAIPPGDSVRLHPGGIHVMLSGLRRPLAAGDSLRAVLRFRRAGPLAITAPVVTYSELEHRMGPADSSHAGH